MQQHLFTSAETTFRNAHSDNNSISGQNTFPQLNNVSLL